MHVLARGNARLATHAPGGIEPETDLHQSTFFPEVAGTIVSERI